MTAISIHPPRRAIPEKLLLSAALLLLAAALLLSCGGGNAVTNNQSSAPIDYTTLCNTQNGGTCSIGFSLDFGGITRTYILHIPPFYKPGVTPLVIFLHGTGNSAAFSENSTLLDGTANQAGFAIVYANAAQQDLNFPVWTIYFGAPPPAAPDDVGFLRQLINTLQTNIRPDPKRIYVVGFSIGAAMAERAGVELSDLVAAVASVDGTLKIDTPGFVPLPAATAPVSVLMVHGDRPDEMVPYCGGPNIQFPNNPWNFASQEVTFNYWSGATANACSTFSTASPLCDSSGNITSVATKIAAGCKGNTEVRLYRLLGGEHQWYVTPMNVPGQAPYNPDLTSATGVTTDDIVWKFFAAHPKP